ncbi:quinol:electron acceptor oxidoreductase subunit ActD [Candidatus Deferrimicrobium sp.]|uniref:quinol:electron acceptor oxidoreductase subunit ActD n=1 Tax=Candidatus Deferrimicrobium sp. TaxID=3060586 RepID=UPI003C4E32B0
MSGLVVVGLFEGIEKAAGAGNALRALPLAEDRITTLSSVPLPDRSVSMDTRPIRFPRITLIGWFAGALAGIALALGTYLLYPLITGGKAIVSVPPTLIITYEVAMLGALIGTLVAGFREMGLMRFRTKVIHDPRIHEGKILLCASVEPGDQARRAIEAMREAGGTEVRTEEGEL